MRETVHYIPMLTTVVAAAVAVTIFARYRRRGGLHLLWWGIGMVTYGLGTITESLTTVFGWQEPVFRLWYITGALLGGAPLAQGTVYLLLPRRTAHRLAAALVSVIAVASLLVVLAPVDLAKVETFRLSGSVFGWQWVRAFSPFINLYAAGFLIGGAILSALRYYRLADSGHRVLGNLAIAVGGLLPGIGGGFTRFGQVEVLYVTEFIGLLLIFLGFRLNTAGAISPKSTAPAPSASRRAEMGAPGNEGADPARSPGIAQSV